MKKKFDTATQSPANRKALHHINDVVSNALAIGGPVITKNTHDRVRESMRTK